MASLPPVYCAELLASSISMIASGCIFHALVGIERGHVVPMLSRGVSEGRASQLHCRIRVYYVAMFLITLVLSLPLWALALMR